MNNKRIHELLEWINDAIRHKDRVLLVPNPGDNTSCYANIIPLEILQHLLEEDVEKNSGRPFCPECNQDWHGREYDFITIDREVFHKRSNFDLEKYNYNICLNCNLKSQEDKE